MAPPSTATLTAWSRSPNRGKIDRDGRIARAGGEIMTEQSAGPQPGSAAPLADLIPQLIAVCGKDAVITDPMELRTYECDGLVSHRCSPGLVVLPETAAQVAAVVRACAGAGVPFVAPATPTALSPPALPPSAR